MVINQKKTFLRGLNYNSIILCLFLIILVWDAIFPSNLAVVALAILVTAPVIGTKKFDIKNGLYHKSGLYLLAFMLLLPFVQKEFVTSRFSSELFAVNFINLILSLQLLWLVPYLQSNYRKSFNNAIDIALTLIGLIFILQLFSYFVLGSYLDILKMFGGKASKYAAYPSMVKLTGLNLIRPTSIFNEPGSYCCFSFVLLSLSYLNHKRVKKIHVFILFTYLISLSAFGIAIAVISISYFVFSELKNRIKRGDNLKKYLVIIIPILIGLGYFLYTYFYIRFIKSKNFGGAELRYYAMEVYLSNPLNDRMLGLSIGYDGLETFFVQDASLLFSVLLYFGLFSIPLVFLIAKYFRFKLIPLFLLFVLSLTKIDVFSFAFWLFVAATPAIYFNSKIPN